MILSAFYKLPELLTADLSAYQNYEGYIQNLFSAAVVTELNSYNISNPLSLVSAEKQYDLSSKNRADLFVKLPYPITGSAIEDYGAKAKNWIEIKYFSRLARGKHDKSSVSRVGNIGGIINDIMRLCILIEEVRYTRRENGRYLLLVFNKEPRRYLPLTREETRKKRIWLMELMNYESSGIKNISIDLTKEEDSAVKKVLKGERNLKIHLRCYINTFFPLTETATNAEYYGYLIEILNFEIWHKNYHMEYDSFSKDRWTPEKINTQLAIVKELTKGDINKGKKSEDSR